MLGVQAERAGDWTVLHVSGEVDMATAPRLRQELVAAVGSHGPFVVVDLSRVAFVDSTGLGVLIGGLVRARRAGGDMLVTGLGPRLEELFELIGLGDVLTVADAGHLSELGIEIGSSMAEADLP